MLIDILAKSRRLSRCRRCGAPITFCETTGGRTMPFDGVIDGRPALTLFSGPDVIAVDTTRNPAHGATCAATKGRHGSTGRR